MSGSYLVHICDINGTIFKSCLGPSVGHTEEMSDHLSIYVRLCYVMSGCVMCVVSCQHMLIYVGAMSDVPGDGRDCWDRKVSKVSVKVFCRALACASVCMACWTM